MGKILTLYMQDFPSGERLQREGGKENRRVEIFITPIRRWHSPKTFLKETFWFGLIADRGPHKESYLTRQSQWLLIYNGT